MMALSAVMVSFPAAVFGAFSLSILHDLNVSQGLLLYSLFGLAMMAALLMTSGWLDES